MLCTDTAEAALARQGLTGPEMLRIAYDVANAYARRTGSGLDSRFDDLAQWLALCGCRVALGYDTSRVHPGYSFQSYLYDVLQKRCVERIEGNIAEQDHIDGATFSISLATQPPGTTTQATNSPT